MRTAEPLILWLQQNQLTQRGLIGIARAVVRGDLRKDACDAVTIEVMKGIVRHKQTDLFGDEVSILEGIFDNALANQVSRMKKSGVKSLTWLKSNKAIACLILSVEDVDAILTAEGSWELVASQLSRVVRCSKLGHLLFHFAFALVNNKAFAIQVQELVDEVMKQRLVTAAVVGDFRAKAQHIIKDFQADGHLVKREISVSFILGKKSPVELQSAELEAEVILHAALKKRALMQKNGLPRLVYEDALLPSPANEDCTISEEVLASMLAARQCAGDVLEGMEDASFADMGQALASMQAELMSLDRTFSLEIGFLTANLDEALAEALQKRILEVLPTASKAVSLSDAIMQLEKLMEADLVKRGGAAVASKLTAVIEVLNGLARAISPPPGMRSCAGFFQPIMARLPFFIRKDALAGAPALVAEFEAIEAAIAKDAAAVKLNQLDILQAFKYLLPSDKQQCLGELVKKLVKSVAKNAKQVAAASNKASKKAKAAPAGSSASSSVGVKKSYFD